MRVFTFFFFDFLVRLTMTPRKIKFSPLMILRPMG